MTGPTLYVKLFDIKFLKSKAVLAEPKLAENI
jgi:hypothetical protein